MRLIFTFLFFPPRTKRTGFLIFLHINILNTRIESHPAKNGHLSHSKSLYLTVISRHLKLRFSIQHCHSSFLEIWSSSLPVCSDTLQWHCSSIVMFPKLRMELLYSQNSVMLNFLAVRYAPSCQVFTLSTRIWQTFATEFHPHLRQSQRIRLQQGNGPLNCTSFQHFGRSSRHR